MPEEYTVRPSPIETYIPENITVHLGPPGTYAPNVTVTFLDYIKNVASSEIYPTWPETAIAANIIAQISFALNRVFTEYYRSRGFDFDITSLPAYDQTFVNGRDTFENVGELAEQLWTTYIRRKGSIEPLYAQYCNGTTTTCSGLSQWGTVALAEQGLSPIEILRSYYGDNIELVENAPVVGFETSVPPYVLRLGAASNDVAILQARLNRISSNYPNIPKIANVNGIYDLSTRDAVTEFQRTFSLTTDGITGRSTWYEVLRVYTAVKKLSELNSEQITYDEIPIVFPLEIAPGSTGNEVRVIQYYLNFISSYYDTVPSIEIDGIYGPLTEASAAAFQTTMGLPATGVIDEPTFDLMYENYLAFVRSLPDESGAAAVPFPGNNLLLGSEGEDVRLLQTYLSVIRQDYPSITELTPDGIFGAQTEQAVKDYQELFGLNVNGVVGSLVLDSKHIQQYRRDRKPAGGTVGNMNKENITAEPDRSITDRPSVVRETQIMLTRLSLHSEKHAELSPLHVGGSLDDPTRKEIEKFQRIEGMNADGELDIDTYNTLKGSYAAVHEKLSPPHGVAPVQSSLQNGISAGEESVDVMMVQLMLNSLSAVMETASLVELSGIYDEPTENAIRELQQIYRIEEDGIVDTLTWNRLARLYGRYGDGEEI